MAHIRWSARRLLTHKHTAVNTLAWRGGLVWAGDMLMLMLFLLPLLLLCSVNCGAIYS